MALCDSCVRGKHSQHDRWTEIGKPGHAGEDAGCPRNVGGNIWVQCTCEVRTPTHPVPAPHCPTCQCGRR